MESIFLKFNMKRRALFFDISFLAPRPSRSVTDLLRTSLLAELSAIVCPVALYDPTSNKTLDLSGAFLPKILRELLHN